MERILKTIFFFCILFGNTVQASPQPIRIPLAATTISLNPAGVQDDSSLWVSRQLNCQLVRLHSGTLEFEAAEQIKFQDPTTIEVTVREGMKFHDGSSIRSDDVIATFGFLKRSRNVFRNVFAWIKKLEKVNPRRFVIHLNRPIPHFLKVLAAPNYALFKKEFIDRAEMNPELWKNPLGCGRYRIATWNPQRIRMEPTGSALPLEFFFMASNQLPASESDKFDLISLAISDGEVPSTKFRTERYLDPAQYYLGLNTRLPRWKKKENRCRFFSSLDTRDVVAQYKDLEGEAATDIYPRGVIGFSPSVHYPRELSEQWGKKASQLGKDFCLMFHASSVASKYRPAFAGSLSKNFSQVITKILPSSVRFGQRFLASGCDGLIIGFKSNYLDAYEYLLLFSEKDANFTGYWDESLIGEIKSSQNYDNNKAKFELYQAIAAKLRNECVLFPILTIPMRKIYVKKELKTPTIGATAVNDYFLGQVVR